MEIALTAEQRGVVDTHGGIILVSAFAGTGKTTLIDAFVKKRVERGVKENRILALTFSTTARERLRSVLPQFVECRTFHSLGSQLLSKHFRLLGYGKAPTLVKDEHPLSVLREVVGSKSWVVVGKDKKSRRLRGSVERLQRELLGLFRATDQLERPLGNVLRDRFSGLGLPLTVVRKIRRAWRRKLRERGLIHFRDMVWAVRRLARKHPATIRGLGYTHLVVDEAQDCSTEQVELLGCLGRLMIEMLVCGDPSQSIFSFRGVRHGTLEDAFPNASRFRLTQTFRLTLQVARLAEDLMKDTQRSRPRFKTDKRGTVPRLVRCDTIYSQNKFVAKYVKSAMKGGLQPSEIAVLARTRSQLNELDQAMLNKGIATVSKHRVVDMTHTKSLVELTRVFQRWLGRPAQELRRQRGTIEREIVDAVHRSIAERPHQDTLDGCRRLLYSEVGVPSPEEIFLLSLKGYLKLARKAFGKVSDVKHHLNRFRPLVVRQHTLHAALDVVNSLTANSPVTLATVYAAKGHEWRLVIVIGLVEGSLPIRTARFPDQVEEERRVLYTAATRSSDKLVLVSAPAIVLGKRCTSPSRFIDLVASCVVISRAD